jgi:hypothetical protein
MTTIGSEISKLRSKLSSLGFDDDNIMSSDELLYQLLNDAGAIIYKRISDKFIKIPDFMYSTFGVKLQEVDEDVYSCENIPDRCRVMESNFILPLALYSRNNTSLKVIVSKKELNEYHYTNYLNEYLADKYSYSIQNGKLRIYGTRALKAVTVKAVWHDIIQWEDHKYCPDTNTVECWDLNTLPFPLYSNPEYASMAHSIIIESLNIPLQEGEKNPSH